MPTTRSRRRAAQVPPEMPATEVASAETQTSVAEDRQPLAAVEGERNLVSPKPYANDGTWCEYLEYFNTVAKINNWSDRTKSDFLGISLTGHSALIYRSLPDAVKGSYQDLVRELSSLLTSPLGSEARLEAFRSRSQRDGEPIAAFYSSLKCLGLEAYPSVPEDCLDGFVKDQFVKGLLDEQLKFQVQLKLPKSSAQALSTALSLEPIVSKASTHSPREPSVGVQGSAMQSVLDKLDAVVTKLGAIESRRTRRRDGEPSVCWRCGKVGHMRQQCTQPAPDKPLN